MDTFHEQLVAIKPTLSIKLTKIAIWGAGVIIAVLSVLFGLKITPLLFFIGAGAIYLAYKANTSFNTEYEYIFTNGTVDVDKIVNKSSRKRVVSFDCKNIEEVVKFNDKKPEINRFLCTDDYENAYVFKVSAESLGKCEVVMSPNEDIKGCFKPYISRSVKNELL